MRKKENMKTKIICFKLSPIVCFIVIATLLLLGSVIIQSKNEKEIRKTNQIAEITTQKENNVEEIKKAEEETNKKEIKKNEPIKNRIMPEEIKGYTVLGTIQIPKIELETYILSETNTKSLNISVTKLCGPEINEIGNFCITGHNYKNNKMFGKIKELEKGDIIIVTDIYGDSITYQVYDKFETNPKDVGVLSQETKGDREVTLITCTMGAINRIIIKAVEVYD